MSLSITNSGSQLVIVNLCERERERERERELYTTMNLLTEHVRSYIVGEL